MKTCEVDMKPNQAYETVSSPATQIPTEPCPAYEDVVVQACNWGWNVLVLDAAVLQLQLHYICTEKYLAVHALMNLVWLLYYGLAW